VLIEEKVPLLMLAVRPYKFDRLAIPAVRVFRTTAESSLEKPNVLTRAQRFDVWGVTVMNPKGWVIVICVLLSKKVIPFVVLTRIVVLVAKEAFPVISRMVIKVPGVVMLDRRTTWGAGGTIREVST
jgi:hypothetical protein